jgi:hypothetical protein
MIHHWQVADSRARRKLLDPEIFLNGSNPPPTDLIALETWDGIMHLPDHVSITTSNHHGHLLQSLYELYCGWVYAIGESGDSISEAMLDVRDDFSASIFLLLHGYYRQSVSCLRSILESMVVGAYIQMVADDAQFKRWRSGEEKISFGKATDDLAKIGRAAALEKHLHRTMGDDLLSRYSPSSPGGWSRRLYQELCRYAHSRPGFTNSDLWRSNGPIYVGSRVVQVAELYVQTYAVGLVFLALARSDSMLPTTVLRGYEHSKAEWARLARACHRFLEEPEN